MALTNSLGSCWPVQISKGTDITPQKGDLLQTSGAAITQGAVNIIGTSTVADEFGVQWLNVWLTAATAGVSAVIYVATTAIAAINQTFSSNAAPGCFMNFGPYGVIGGAITTTNTVYVITSGGTATVNFALGGFRKV